MRSSACRFTLNLDPATVFTEQKLKEAEIPVLARHPAQCR